jgi:hypothetical protein
MPCSTTNFTTPYAFVFHNNSIFPKYFNIALYSENKRYVLLKKAYALYVYCRCCGLSAAVAVSWSSPASHAKLCC